MAKMKDPKPTRPGEAKTWQCFADGLPKDYIVYFNRSVYTWEFDFCVLAPKQGLFIVEVKGWSPEYVVNVLNSNQINLKGEEKPVKSPRSQARAYCFDLVGLLKEKYGFNPLVLDMVCYPEISKEEYYRKRLDVVSDEYETVFKEELMDPKKLLDKFNKRFYQGDKAQHDFMDDKLYARIRHYFEPDYDLKDNIEILNPGYSRLEAIYVLLPMFANVLTKYDAKYYFDYKDEILSGSVWHNQHGEWMKVFEKMMGKPYLDKYQEYCFLDQGVSSREADASVLTAYLVAVNAATIVDDNQKILLCFDSEDRYRAFEGEIVKEADNDIQNVLKEYDEETVKLLNPGFEKAVQELSAGSF